MASCLLFLGLVITSGWLLTQAYREADRNQRIATAVNEFFNEQVLRQADPTRNSNREITLREVLNKASTELDGRFPDEPEIEAELRMTLGRTFRSLGEHEIAFKHLERGMQLYDKTLGPASAPSIEARVALALVQGYRGEFDVMGELLLEALQGAQETHGEQHKKTADVLTHLGSYSKRIDQLPQAVEYCERAVDILRRESGDEDRTTIVAMNELASLYSRLKRFSEAIPLARLAYESGRELLGAEHPHVLVYLSNYGLACSRAKQYAEAEVMMRRSVKIAEKVHGPDQRATWVACYNLSGLLLDMGQAEGRG